MDKKFRKRIQALLMAAMIAVTTLGSVTTVTAQSSAEGGSLMDFSFPFDFLFFRFGEEEETMTEEDLEAERNRLREQSMKAEEAAGLKMVYEYTMENPESLSTLDLSVCEGNGTFVFADSEFVPEKGVSVCEFVFIPDDVDAYEYELMLGWDEQSQTLRRYAEIVCSSLVALEEEVMEAPEEEESVIPDAVETIPEATPTPDAEDTPEATPTPDAEDTLEVTPTPDAEDTLEVTPTPDAEDTLEVTPTPDAEDIPEAIPTPDAEDIPEVIPVPDVEVSPETTLNPEETGTSKPGNNLIPEITTIPELVTPEATPEVTPTPEPIVTAPIKPGSSAESAVQIIEKDDTVKAFEVGVLEFAEGHMTEEQMSSLLTLTNAYHALTAEQQNAVSSDVMNKLAGIQELAAAVNHTSNGVTVSGNVPWFVKLRVSIGNDTDTYVPTGLETIVPYEMSLWNLLTDCEYVLSGGEKVTLTMAVPENIHLYDGLTIVHYMDETHYEYIELKISGDSMSFETASFSPFNVAGSTILVGGKPGSSTSDTNPDKFPEKPVTPTTKPSNSTSVTKPSNSASETKSPGSADNKNNTTITKPVVTNKPVSNNSNSAVKTGDSANVSRFVMLGLGSVILIMLCVMLMKQSRKGYGCE